MPRTKSTICRRTKHGRCDTIDQCVDGKSCRGPTAKYISKRKRSRGKRCRNPLLSNKALAARRQQRKKSAGKKKKSKKKSKKKKSAGKRKKSKKKSAGKKKKSAGKKKSKKKSIGCRKLSTKKYRTRPGPAYAAQACRGKTKKGNDKKMYKSVPNKNGVYRWVKVTSLNQKKKTSKKKSVRKKKQANPQLKEYNAYKRYFNNLSAKDMQHELKKMLSDLPNAMAKADHARGFREAAKQQCNVLVPRKKSK
jgi:hypothetical protein